jgi:hypothetical protein
MASQWADGVRQSLVMAKHRWLRRTIGLGVVAGATYAVWRAIEKNQTPGDSGWEPQPFPFPPQPRTGDAPGRVSGSASAERDEQHAMPDYLEPVGGACPPSHPVKAKLASGIFHVPGGQSYERTTPDRCYLDGAAAMRDGLRASKR